jgi:dipeptide/tripeptide permease
MLYSPTIFYLDEWFIKRKDLAFSIMWAGTGILGLILPFILQWALSTYGFRTTLCIWALIFVLMAGPFVYFVKPRHPVLPIAGPAASRSRSCAHPPSGFCR